jgi:hypothetical protein
MHWIYAHLIGDWILQTHWMAMHKKKSALVCLLHVTLYMLPFLYCGLMPWQLLAIGLQHYLQDRTHFVVWFMFIKGSGEFAKPPTGPWSCIVVDNVLHILFMAWVTSF